MKIHSNFIRPGRLFNLLLGLIFLSGLFSADLLAQPAAPDSAASAPQAPTLEQEMNPQRLMAVMAEAQKAGDFPTMEKAAFQLVRLRPQVGTFHYFLVKAYALQDKKSEAYNALLRLSNQGLTFDLSADPDLENIRGTQVFDFLVEGLQKNAEMKGEVARTVTLGQTGLLADGLAFDPKKREMLIGSVTQGVVYRILEGGELKPLVAANQDNGLLGVFDIAVDNASRSLWVSSAAVPHYRNIRFQDAGYSGVFQFDLDSGQIRRRFDVPGRDPGNKLVNLTVASDGKVYAANAAKHEVYQIDVERERMTRIFSAPGFTSIRGLAVSPDAKTLYFSDYELGLFGVNLETEKAFMVRTPATVNLGGVDSLSWYKDGMVVLQNGNLPHRALRLSLNDEGNAVTGAVPLLANHPLFLAPSEGIVVGDLYHIIANGNAPLYNNASGKPNDPSQIKAQAIVTVNANVDMSAKPVPKAL